MPDLRIETPRLALREWAPGDIDRFAEVTNTPEVMRWLGGPMDTARVDMFESRMMAFQITYGHTFWIVERKADGGHLAGEILGFCGLKKIDAEGASFAGETEIGWRLREDAWGRGYAKEAAMASLEAAFGRFNAREVFAITVIGNSASWGLMERLGMRRRQELDFVDPRYPPPLCDTITYSITPEQWQEQV